MSIEHAIYDDRLDTVLRGDSSTPSGAAAQYRQLLDLIGNDVTQLAPASAAVALSRLHALRFALSAQHRLAAVAELGSRLRSPALLRYLCEDRPEIATQAVSSARLTDSQWAALIPDLPVRARGLLRHRRDIGPQATRLLAQLGVQDMALPAPPFARAEPQPAMPLAPAAEPLVATRAPDNEAEQTIRAVTTPLSGISAIVERIEAYRRARDHAMPSVTHPTAVRNALDRASRLTTIDFEANARGEVIWADGRAAPLMIGRMLRSSDDWSPTRADAITRNALMQRVHLQGGSVTLDGPDVIAGNWRCDATPLFDATTGHYTGHAGRLRRPAQPAQAAVVSVPEPDITPQNAGSSDELRQVLHELRTPINAVQGFAEIIRHQLFGPVARDYRDRAASIADDAGRLHSLFLDIDQLARDASADGDSSSAESHRRAADIIASFNAGSSQPAS